VEAIRDKNWVPPKPVAAEEVLEEGEYIDDEYNMSR